MLGFVLLVPWLIALDGCRSLGRALLCAWAMSLAYTVAGFAWFGAALGRYTQLGEASGIALLLLAAPLFQPQFLAYALVRYATARWYGRGVCALAAAAAWVALEWLAPRMLGDTLGYGLYPSRLLRQAADVGGTAGLTLWLLLANEAVAAGLVRYRAGWRSCARPLALAALAPAVLAAYGAVALSGSPAPASKPLRMALIQANMVDYERQRQEQGAYAVVREVLDRHFAMGYDAVTRQRAEALLWSETAYPTTFGKPKSSVGAEFDREIVDYVNAAAVPLVFGTYDRDGRGEYNAAAFVQPGRGLVGMYRKSHLFPFTEYLPAWLDGQWARRLLPWAGNWVAGSGARVFPLRLADGREIPVLPMICRDDVDTGLAVAGARLGGQVILTMSNDSWFSGDGPGARLHQAGGSFPQHRNAPAAVPCYEQRLQRRDRCQRRYPGRYQGWRAGAGDCRSAATVAGADPGRAVGRLGRAGMLRFAAGADRQAAQPGVAAAGRGRQGARIAAGVPHACGGTAAGGAHCRGSVSSDLEGRPAGHMPGLVAE